MTLSPRVLLALVAMLAQAPRAQTPLHAFPGQSPGQQLGFAVRIAGDVDRDARDDILVGVPFASDQAGWAGKATLLSGATGKVLQSLAGTAAGARFGYAVSDAGDANRDGWIDIAIGAPFADATGMDSGEVRVVSGKDGAVLWTVPGVKAFDAFGHAVAGAGDVDGDGHGDLLVGAPYSDASAPDGGTCYLVSGRTAALLSRIDGAGPDDHLGWSVAGAGDADQDGTPDLAVGAPEHFQGDGYARVVSGRTGGLLRTYSGTATTKEYGASVAGAGDVDADGYPDLIAGHFGSTIALPNAGGADVLSGRDGTPLHRISGGRPFDHLGASVATAGDVDGDGRADFAVGAYGGYAEVRSGATGALLVKLSGIYDQEFGTPVSSGDVDGDGVPDLAVGSRLADTVGGRAGAAHVFTLAQLSLRAGGHAVQLSQGGTQSFTLDAGTSAAGRTYFLAGSMSGTSPGIQLGPITLPLNLDPYFSLTASQPNRPPLSRSFGALDAAGRATAAFVLPPALPATLGGTVLHHAFLVLDAAGLPLSASNPVAVLLLR